MSGMFTWKLAKKWRQLVGVPETDPSEPESGSPTWVEVEFRFVSRPHDGDCDLSLQCGELCPWVEYSAEGPEESLRLAWISYCDISTQVQQ